MRQSVSILASLAAELGRVAKERHLKSQVFRKRSGAGLPVTESSLP